MTKRKLRGYAKPTLLLISMAAIFMTVMLITKNLKPKEVVDNEDYVVNSILDIVTPVVSTTPQTLIKPYTSENVAIDKSFYEKDGTEEDQQKSLIYYENTYLQNSGIVYAGEEEFDCVAVFDGTVVDVKQDELLNTVVYVSHNTNLTTIYYGLKDVNLKANDVIKQGDILGKSTTNKFSSKNNSILFEVNYNGQVLNPESFYQMDINELN